MKRLARLALVTLVASCAACTRPVQLMSAPDGVRKPAPDAGAMLPRSAVLGDETPGELRGEWAGTGQQSDGASWPMRLDVTGTGAHCATIAYPTVGCQGYWDCGGSEDGAGWREAEEHIQGGSCIDGGTFRYRLRGEQLEWTWYKKPRAGRRTEEDQLTAHGTLTRDAGNAPDWGIDEE